MRSLQSKLGTGLILSLLAVFAILWFLISHSIQSLAEEYIASRLSHDAETLLAMTKFDRNNKPVLNELNIDQIYQKPYSGHYFSIETSSHRIQSRSFWDQQLSKSNQLKAGEHQRRYAQGPNGQALLVVSHGFIKQQKHITITVAEDLNPVHVNIKQFQKRFAVIAMSLLLLLLILQVFILRFSLTPLTRIQHEIQALQQGETRQLSQDVPSELRPLIKEINHLLMVMDQRLRRSRDALGDLAHAIKKPLTVIQQLVTKEQAGFTDDRMNALEKQTREIDLIAERILKRARLAGQSHTGEHFDFSQDLAALLDTLKQMYSNKTIEIKAELPELLDYPIDRQDMMELLGNLLDNAWKWARHTVHIQMHLNNTLSISIEDDGPGANTEQLTALARRGTRLDETVHGYGLGLAIAADIVAEYNGTIHFGHSDDLGGFRVDLSLPR